MLWRMKLRLLVLCGAGLPLLAASPAFSPQGSALPTPATELLGIETPQISGEIDSALTLAVGRAEIRPSPGARVFVLSADGRACGVLVDGPATLTYRVQDAFSIPLARRNVGRASGIAVREAGSEMTLSATLQGAAVWGWNLELSATAPRPVTRSALPKWLHDLLEDKLEPNPGRDMLLSTWNAEAGYRWAVLHTAGDDLMLDVDPRPATMLESLHRVYRLPRTTGALSGSLATEVLVAQPISKSWSQPAAIDVVAVETDLQVRNTAGDHVTVTARTRLQSSRDGLRGLSLALLTERGRPNGERRPFKITKLTVDGAPAASVHWRDNLLVHLPRALGKGDSTIVELTAEGDILDRPDGDRYWRLGSESWYPRPNVGGIERAAFRISVETSPPFVPFAAGEVLERITTGPTRAIVTRLNGPMEAANVVAGTYSSFTDETAGGRVHVSTYASGRKEEALRVAGIVEAVRGCLANWLGVPYPFQDLQIVEINQWGWGQAPPGIIYVTREAFLTPARASTLDGESSFIAQQVSRGVNERLAHEVAHAWFPHVAKVDRIEENWLSESLADYTSSACLQQIDDRRGKALFARQLAEWKVRTGQIGAGASIYLAAYLGTRETDSRDWQSLLYAKGPLVLHAIRQELARASGSAQEGDRLFFTWIRSYVRNFTFKAGETRHLVGILNQVTKKDWQPWFERYVYGTETPRLD